MMRKDIKSGNLKGTSNSIISYQQNQKKTSNFFRPQVRNRKNGSSGNHRNDGWGTKQRLAKRRDGTGHVKVLHKANRGKILKA